MPFTLHRSNSIAVGSFNIYVFQPIFIGQIAGVPEGTRFDMEADFSRPGFKATFADSALEFYVRPDRVMIETVTGGTDCGAVLSRVLDRLPWTPIEALGHNFVFWSNRSECDGMLENASFPFFSSEDEGKVHRTWHAAINIGSVVYNLQVSQQPDKCELSANAHLPSKNLGRDARDLFSKRFLETRQEAIDLLRTHFRATIEL